MNETLTRAQLVRMRTLLQEMGSQRSVADRVLGFFSFVNIVWVVSIVGVLATLGPCLGYVIGPFLLRMAATVHELVLLPLHRIGVWEAVAYAFVFLLSAQSCRYPANHTAGTMVALTAGLSAAPCWAYSTALWAESNADGKQAYAALSGTLMALELAPLALLRGSALIGFCTVGAMYVALGFCFGAFGLVFFVGFSSEAATRRCTLASLTLVLVFSALRMGGAPPALLQPFATGAMVLGNVVYFLGLLILCSAWTNTSNVDTRWWLRPYYLANGAMLVSITLAVLIGSIFAIPAATNTACVYLVLWAMEKELEVEWGAAGIAVLFGNFVALYFAAHFLHTHPQLVTSLFDPSGVYYS